MSWIDYNNMIGSSSNILELQDKVLNTSVSSSTRNNIDTGSILAIGAGLAGQALQGYANKYLNTGDLYNDILAKGILGDTSSGTLSLLFDNANGNSMNNALEAISNSRNVSAGATTNLGILNAYKSLKPVTSLQKPKGNVSNILGSTLKGAATGFAAGTALPGIGNIVGTIGGAALGLIGGVGTLIGLNKRYEALKEAEQNNYRQALDNLSLAAYNTSKLSNLNSLRNMSRYGGYINRFDLGGDLLNLISVDAGGSHEQNPYGGVFVNSNSTVELNEKISTDGKKLEYVWSDTLKVPKDLRKKYKLKDDITFAEAIEKVNKEASERVLDHISKNGQNAIFNEFKQSLEELRMKKELKQIEKNIKNISQSLLPLYRKYNEGGDLNTYLRYAPALGNIFAIGQNAFSKTDYSMPNRIAEERAKLLPYSAPLVYKYMPEITIDTNKAINQFSSEANTVNNAIMNTTNPNRNSSLLANSYNAYKGLGELMSGLELLRLKNKQLKAQFDLDVDRQNAASILLTNQFNQAILKDSMDALYKEIALRNQIDTDKSSSMSKNLSGLFTNLGNIGTDNLGQAMALLSVISKGVPLDSKTMGLVSAMFPKFAEYLKTSN